MGKVLEIYSQSSINQKCYEFLRNEARAMAIAVFKRNVQAYSGSANVYDSLGEAYQPLSDHALGDKSPSRTTQRGSNDPQTRSFVTLRTSELNRSSVREIFGSKAPIS
jgi:hypothetical protein